MEFMELAKSRYSVRSFSGKKIEDEKLGKILEAARISPTAANQQPQKIYVLQSEQALRNIN
ncbi:MAG: nitroreductase family protein, partial [Treponemataceae bacterium]|nr:nitroreductase family protein [Treponemataceae bacterium]